MWPGPNGFSGLIQGDWGWSFEFDKPVNEVVGDALWLTLLVNLAVVIFVHLVSIPIAIYSATRQYSVGDYIATFIGYIGLATPSFLLALILLVLALAPGARARHTIADDRLAVVVDDGVIASALARSARTIARSRREDTSASIGRRTAVVSITPASGIGVDRDAVQKALDEELERIAPQPATRASVRVADSGRI